MSRKLPKRKLMKALMRQSGGSYAKAAKWFQVSQTYGNGSYGRPEKICPCCNQKIPWTKKDPGK